MRPFGDRALSFEVTGGPRRRRALLEALRKVEGVIDVVVAEQEACVVLAEGADHDAARAAISGLVVDEHAFEPSEHSINVIYDGTDLDDVATRLGLSKSALVEAHASADYVVSMVGFMPGFAYLRGLPSRLVLPRRASPRPRVPASSVAMAAEYTGIYPASSPGGWHLLGRAPAFVPFSLALGDTVRFEAVSAEAMAEATSPRRPDAPSEAERRGEIEVVALQGFAHVVAAEAHGRMHEGVPPGGPLVRSALERGGGAPVVEVFGTITLRCAGTTLKVTSGPHARVGYIGVEGGFTRIGPLRRGDRLALAHARTTPFAIDVTPSSERVAILPGPDARDRATLDALVSRDFTISSTSNRVGTRLEGPPVAVEAESARASTPMIKGAIEATPRGLVVLGPDHPTTGGYPAIAVLRTASMDDFFARGPGSVVRFRLD